VASFIAIEKTMLQALQKDDVTSVSDPSAAKLFKTARELSNKGKHEKAAPMFGALASLDENDFNFPLRAAQSYQKAELIDQAARWYFETTRRYANQHYASQAFATLRIYRNLKPNDVKGPKSIYHILRSQGDTGDDILHLLSSKDQAAHKLRPNDLFACFDDQTFDNLLENMTYLKLYDGQKLTNMGDKASSLFFVLKGQVAGYVTLNGNKSHLGTVSAGDICGEVGYFTGGNRTTDMIAVGTTEVMELPYIMLDALKHKSPDLESHLEKLYRNRMLVTQLSISSVFGEVPIELREKVALKMTSVKLPAGQTLMRSDEFSMDCYLVRAGKLAINLLINGSERLLKTVETGGILGEMSIAVKGKRTATTRAVTDCILMKLNGDDYANFYKESPKLQEVIKKRKKLQMAETMEMVKGKHVVEGDDTCQILLKDIWQSTTTAFEAYEDPS